MNAAVKFSGCVTWRLARQQCARAHFKHLGEALVLTPFLIGELLHSIG